MQMKTEANNEDERLLRNCPQSSSPRLNRVPSAPMLLRPNSEVCPKMRPTSATRYNPPDAGEGRDYYDVMFSGKRRVKSSTRRDVINATCSATGNLQIEAVDDECVKIHNSSSSRVETIGNCLIQQNVAGNPVAVFRFPPRTKLPPSGICRVWTAKSRSGVHDPPKHFLWKQLDKWGTGPQCTTILCKPNGQAVAWTTSPPRITQRSRSNDVTRLQIEAGAINDAKSVDDVSCVAQQPTCQPYASKPTLYFDVPPKPPSIPSIKVSATAEDKKSKSKKIGVKKQQQPGLKLRMPGSFHSPADQHRQALLWLQTNHNSRFNPPMPEPHRQIHSSVSSRLK